MLFIPSDNNASSGAFLSMVMLNKLLNEDFGVDTYVILPREGTGVQLLKENNIKHKIIYSYNWVVSIKTKRDKTFLNKVEREKARNKTAIKQIARFAKREEFDLIHINTTYSYVGALAAKKIEIPVIWHLREFLEEDQNRTMWDREKGNRLISEADRVIAISQSVYNKYLPIVGKEKLRKIYNGIDSGKFYKPHKEIFNTEKSIFIFVGTINLNKGQIQLLEACAKLVQNGIDNFEVWFIGTSNDVELRRLKECAKAGGFLDKVTFFGYQKNVADFYEKADISFTCSKFEAFGRTTVEAMLSGNLVIGADTGGTKELISHKKTGLLYCQGNIEDLYQKIMYALKHRDEMKKIASAGRTYMAEHMTALINAKHVYNLYKEVLKK